jgi:hypothetical protein
MRDAAKIFVLLTALVIAPGVRAQDANALAEQEAVKRQEATIRLHQRVIEAEDAEKKGRIVDATKLYQEAYTRVPFAVVGDPRVEADKVAAANGLVRMRVELANRARKNGDLLAAQTEINNALNVGPRCEGSPEGAREAHFGCDENPERKTALRNGPQQGSRSGFEGSDQARAEQQGSVLLFGSHQGSGIQEPLVRPRRT